MSKLRKVIGVLLSVIMVIATVGTMTPVTVAHASTLTPVQLHGQLSVKGTQIVDKNGKAFQLHGISTHGINWDVGRPYVNKDAFQTLRDDWGANAVRLAMYTAEYNGYCEGGNQTELKKLVYSGVQYATELGMYAVIDWHILKDNNPNKYIKQAKTFWAEVSKKYKDSNNVIYEICNEPNGGDVTWDVIKSYANVIIPIIRANDPDAIIIVGTPTWSQLGMQGHTNEVADSPLTGYSNIVYALHFYCAESSHSQYLPAKVDYAVSKGLPVIVSEFGLSEASGNGRIDTTQATAWFEKLDGYGIGYFCWSLSNKPESASLIASGCSETSGWSESDLTDAGKFIRAEYRARKETVIDEEAMKKIDAFVVRLYKLVLGREPEAGGRAYWANQLATQSQSGAKVGYGFVFSDEYKAKKTDDSAYIEMLYKVFFDRSSDKAGKAYWQKCLDEGLSREYVLASFMNSKEYTKICEDYGIIRGSITLTQNRDKNANLTRFISRIYSKALSRSWDEKGLNYWCGMVQSKKMTPEAVAENFILSAEFTRKNLNNEEFVKVLYRTYMDREADSAGLKYWVGLLNGGTTRKQAIRAFAGTPEFKKIKQSFGL